MESISTETLKARLKSIRGIISIACAKSSRDPEEVLFIAVSKGRPIDLLLSAYRIGIRDFGESYYQELFKKARAFSEQGINDFRFHFIGQLQTNKIKKLCALENLEYIHTLASKPHADLFADYLRNSHKELKFLIQVNFTGHHSRYGVLPADVENLLEHCLAKGISVRGLMCLPMPSAGYSSVASSFSQLRKLRDSLQAKFKVKLPQLSMGMSNDFAIAVEQGSTMVRIGTAFFGELPKD